MQAADRVDPPPDRPEGHAEGYDPYPQQDEDDERHGVAGVVAADQQGGEHVQGERRTDAGERDPGGARVEQGGDRAGQRAAGVRPVQPRGWPQHGQGDEREDQDGRGAGHGQPERQRQVLAAADAVGEDRAVGQHGGGRAAHRTCTMSSCRARRWVSTS